MQIYLVGGAVRDSLLNKQVTERDYVVVGATAEEMLTQGFQQVGKDFPVFLHPQTGEEYALARTERKQGVGYTGFSVHAAPDVTLEQDLLRRDLTINAIAQASDGHLIDPYGGRSDLAKRCLRHVSPAFVEDPLRVLRVARFAARFAKDGFYIASETLALMQQISADGELASLANERVWHETVKALNTSRPWVYFSVLANVDALTQWYPELADDTLLQRLEARYPEVPEQQSEQVFLLLMAELTETQIEQFCARLRVPNEWRALALIAQRYHAHHHDVAASDLFANCLHQADCWRRPERWQKLRQLWQLQGVSEATLERLQRAYAAAVAVHADEVIAAAAQRGETLQGPAIGAAVSRARAAAISNALEEDPE